MKKFLSLALLSLISYSSADESPSYRSEAPLPKGWPKPGPYNQAVEKKYPAYRAAFTTSQGQTGAFWRLFRHIKRKDIPMTAPVEMSLEPRGENLGMASMAFLYQSTTVGETGADGQTVEVRDIPAQKVVSYTWMGRQNNENVNRAKKAVEDYLKEKKLTAQSYRLLGYNGPSTPKTKATWELQALLK